MKTKSYGVITSNNYQIDTSKTLRGAKNHATRHGYTLVSKRIGYNVSILEERIDNKWVKL